MERLVAFLIFMGALLGLASVAKDDNATTPPLSQMPDIDVRPHSSSQVPASEDERDRDGDRDDARVDRQSTSPPRDDDRAPREPEPAPEPTPEPAPEQPPQDDAPGPDQPPAP